MEESEYNSYVEVCRRAVEDDRVFNQFKRDERYTAILEHVSPALGGEYLAELTRRWRLLVPHIDWVAVQKLDSIGNPRKSVYDLMELSPTTLRYIFYGLYILSLQSKKALRIVEIGGGHGGQCYILHVLAPLFNIKIESYTIIDIKEVVALQNKCLSKLGIPCTYLPANSYMTGLGKYDLCMSNYALGELPLRVQTDYLRVVEASDRHFFVWNMTPIHQYFTDRSRIHRYQFEREVPCSGGSVVIYTK